MLFRSAGLTMGFKDKVVADKAVTKNRPKKIAKSMAHEFDVEIIDSSAPPPPVLPISTIQALGQSQCQIPPSEITDDKLKKISG